MKKLAIKHMIERFEIEHGPDNCWMWPYCKDNSGYGKVMINGKIKYAHKVAFEIGRGIKLNNQRLWRRCSNPSCMNYHHLNRDRPVNRKLSQPSLRNNVIILAMNQLGCSQVELAKALNTDQPSISRILRSYRNNH